VQWVSSSTNCVFDASFPGWIAIWTSKGVSASPSLTIPSTGENANSVDRVEMARTVRPREVHLTPVLRGERPGRWQQGERHPPARPKAGVRLAGEAMIGLSASLLVAGRHMTLRVVGIHDLHGGR
jgi:hypothetical protein